MQFGWTILHVPDVPETVAFYEKAFGMHRRFIDDQGEFAEMETGTTKLAFAAHRLVERMGFHGPGRPHGMEIALVTEADQVEAAYGRAVEAGAEAVQAPERKPWGQIVGFVRDPNGFLVEICSPVPASPPAGN